MTSDAFVTKSPTERRELVSCKDDPSRVQVSWGKGFPYAVHLSEIEAPGSRFRDEKTSFSTGSSRNPDVDDDDDDDFCILNWLLLSSFKKDDDPSWRSDLESAPPAVD